VLVEVPLVRAVGPWIEPAGPKGRVLSPDVPEPGVEVEQALADVVVEEALTTAEIIAELVAMAKELRDAKDRHEQLHLTDSELAFYDAVCQNDSAVMELGDETLKAIARELIVAVRESAIDWSLKESVRAGLRARVRRLLNKYGYPPDKQDRAVDLVIEQAERIAADLGS